MENEVKEDSKRVNTFNWKKGVEDIKNEKK